MSRSKEKATVDPDQMVALGVTDSVPPLCDHAPVAGEKKTPPELSKASTQPSGPEDDAIRQASQARENLKERLREPEPAVPLPMSPLMMMVVVWFRTKRSAKCQ